jgi:hypothetical protein
MENACNEPMCEAAFQASDSAFAPFKTQPVRYKDCYLETLYLVEFVNR